MSEQIKPFINLNTILTSLVLIGICWIGNNTFQNSKDLAGMKSTLDERAILLKQMSDKLDRVMPRDELEIKLLEMRTRIVALEFEVGKIKEKK